MKKSHAAGWASDAPTPAQVKELFSQIDAGRITKTNFQAFLRNEAFEAPKCAAEPLQTWFRRRRLIPCLQGVEGRSEDPTSYPDFGLLHGVPDGRRFPIGRYRRPYVALIDRKNSAQWTIRVYGLSYVLFFQELAKEIENDYHIQVTVELGDKRPAAEHFRYSD